MPGLTPLSSFTCNLQQNNTALAHKTHQNLPQTPNPFLSVQHQGGIYKQALSTVIVQRNDVSLMQKELKSLHILNKLSAQYIYKQPTLA